MKVYVYEKEYGDIVLNKVQLLWKSEHKYLGEVDLDIKPNKKMIKKEVDGELSCRDEYTVIADHVFPGNAKNIKITYEIEE
jgi:hypothetical protein